MDRDKKIQTEEYYVASIDLLGIKNVIKFDTDDSKLNSIRNIYKSWYRIFKDNYFEHLKIKFFSDNFVIAIKATIPSAVDRLLESIAWICSHLLKCGYKPRGGISKGKFYMDDIFVWGQGLVNAYIIESKKAIYPRIVIEKNVAEKATKNLTDTMIYQDSNDGKLCLNYLRAFGVNKDSCIKDIDLMLGQLTSEVNNIQKLIDDGADVEENKKILHKLQWLFAFAKENKLFWENS